MPMISVGQGLKKMAPVHIPSSEVTADASTFVCEFTAASGNETGVGGGLTGADLVLTAFGNPAGVSGGFRALDGVDDYFKTTAAFMAAMLNGAEWTIMWRLKNWAHNATAKYLARLVSNNSNAGYLETGKVGTLGNYNFEAFNSNGGQNRLTAGGVLANTFDGWVAIWRKGNILHGGFSAGEVVPTGWDFFPSTQRMFASGLGSWSAATWPTYTHIVGSSDGYPALSIAKLVVSKTGLAGLLTV